MTEAGTDFVVLRLAPPSLPPRRDRIDELERIISCNFLIESMSDRSVEGVLAAVSERRAKVLVLDVRAKELGEQLAARLGTAGVTVVVAPNTVLGFDTAGRQIAKFEDYRRLTPTGEMLFIEDGELGS